MTPHTQLAILFAGLAIVVVAVSELARRRTERRRAEREDWDAVCQRWLREGKITGYTIGSEFVVIEFPSNDWHHYSL